MTWFSNTQITTREDFSYVCRATTAVKKGEEIVTSLCEELLAMGAPGLHFYTMNQAEPTIAIWDNLNL